MNISTEAWHPLNAGEILDRAFRLYRVNFWLFTQVMLFVLVPFLLLAWLYTFITQDLIVPSLLGSFLTINFLNGPATWVAAQAYIGSTVSIRDAYQQALGCLWSFLIVNFRLVPIYLVSWIVGTLACSVVAAPLFALTAFVPTVYTPWYTAIILLVAALPILLYMVYCVARWGVVIPALVIDKLSAKDAMVRSWSMTAPDFSHVIAVLVGAHLLFLLIVTLPGITTLYFLTMFSLIGFVGFGLLFVLMEVGTLFAIPLAMSILVILYYDLRVRREGYDLESGLQIPETGDVNEQA